MVVKLLSRIELNLDVSSCGAVLIISKFGVFKFGNPVLDKLKLNMETSFGVDI